MQAEYHKAAKYCLSCVNDFTTDKEQSCNKPRNRLQALRWQFQALETCPASSLHILPKLCPTIKQDHIYPKKSQFPTVI